MMTDTLGQWNVNSVIQADALELIRALPDASVDAIITDLPYGTTACSWDEIIPFEPMWAGVKRVLKPRGAFVTTASQPFTSKLVMSNLAWFKYGWVWEKERATGFNYAKYQPMRLTEDILVFGDKSVHYFPQMLLLDNPYVAPFPIIKSDSARMTSSGLDLNGKRIYKTYTHSFPKNLVRFPREFSETHPTQKPVALYEYLIRTYTLPNQLVLDFCCGSGTTLVAAQRLGRRFLGCDLSAEYVEMARKRLSQPFTPSLFADEPLAAREDDQQLELFVP